MCRFLSVFCLFMLSSCQFHWFLCHLPQWFLSVNFPQVYSMGIFFRELFLFCTQSALCVAFTSDVFCSLLAQVLLPSCALSQRQLWKVVTTSLFFLSYSLCLRLSSGRPATSLHSPGHCSSLLLAALASRENGEPFILCYFSENTTGFLILFFLFSKVNIYLLM